MGDLPKIREQLIEAMEYFEPIAKLIHSELEQGAILNKTIDLTSDWLGIESSKARDLFFKSRGINISG